MKTQPLTEEIAKAVDMARITAGLSKNGLAERTDPTIKRAQLQRKLSGTVSFSIEELALIADVLEVPVTDFFIIPDDLRQVAS